MTKHSLNILNILYYLLSLRIKDIKYKKYLSLSLTSTGTNGAEVLWISGITFEEDAFSWEFGLTTRVLFWEGIIIP